MALTVTPVRVKRLTPTAKLPTRGSLGAIGLDLYADNSVAYGIQGGDHDTIHTGISIAIPQGWYGRIAPRSGLASKHGIDVLAGVIDSDYRGEILVVLHNTSRVTFLVSAGDRIAQLIFERADTLPLVEVDNLDDTARGNSGFGSTGT